MQNIETKKSKFKFETSKKEERIWRYLAIGGNDSAITTKIKLYNMIQLSPKFLCINDVVNYDLNSEALQLKKIQKQFYLTLFPKKSSFELESKTHKKSIFKNFFLI
jgi:hypothetical protein